LPEEKDHMFKDQLETRLSVAFGGRAAEEIIFNRITTGASMDIKQATDLAQKMVRSWGMSEELGPLSYAQGEEHVFLGREIAQHRDYSEATAQKIDNEINRLIKTAYERSRSVLKEHISVLHALADLLLEKETVMGKELDELILSIEPDAKLPAQTTEDPAEGTSAPPSPQRPAEPSA
jgi:cell division protease FtsH